MLGNILSLDEDQRAFSLAADTHARRKVERTASRSAVVAGGMVKKVYTLAHLDRARCPSLRIGSRDHIGATWRTPSTASSQWGEQPGTVEDVCRLWRGIWPTLHVVCGNIMEGLHGQID